MRVFKNLLPVLDLSRYVFLKVSPASPAALYDLALIVLLPGNYRVGSVFCGMGTLVSKSEFVASRIFCLHSLFNSMNYSLELF